MEILANCNCNRISSWRVHCVFLSPIELIITITTTQARHQRPRPVIQSFDDYFVFGICYSCDADDLDDELNVVDYDYPADFNQRRFVPTLRRLVSRIKSILSNCRSRPLERSTSGQDLVTKMQRIISMGDDVFKGDARSTLLRTLRKGDAMTSSPPSSVRMCIENSIANGILESEEGIMFLNSRGRAHMEVTSRHIGGFELEVELDICTKTDSVSIDRKKQCCSG